MTSVCACYCKDERNVPCSKDNGVGASKEKRHPTAASKKPIMKNTACGGGEESRRMRSVIDGETPLNHRSAEAQPSRSVLSPETSTALENAEKIIDSAKIQLVEICGMSRPDSARQNVDTYPNDPPLDDEAEELLYIRELVASKLHKATSSSRCENASGKASSRGPSRVASRRVDLSAPKFRMSRDDRSSSLATTYRSVDDRGSRQRAALTEVPSKDSLGHEDEAGAMMARDRWPASSASSSSSSASGREAVGARGKNACGIQIGPSLQIVARELTRQDLEDLHISPEPEVRARSRANTATYAVRHGVVSVKDNEAEMSRAAIVPRARLDPPRREKRDRSIDLSADVATIPRDSERKWAAERLATGQASPRLLEDEQIESPISSRARQYILRGNERSDQQGSGLRDATAQRNPRILERSESTMNGAAADYAAVTADTRPADGKSKWNQAEVTVRRDRGERSNKSGEIDRQAESRPREEDGRRSTADGIRLGDQGDRSEPRRSADSGGKRKTAFLRRGNIASRYRYSVEGTRVIDEYFSDTYYDDDVGGRQTKQPYDVADENAYRSSRVSRPSDFRAKDDLIKADLYQPHFHDLDLILLSNEERLERVTRAAEGFVESLSRPEFTRYKLPDDDDKRSISRHDTNPEKSYRESSTTDREFDEEGIALARRNELMRSSMLETEVRNEDLTASPRTSGLQAADARLRTTSGDNGTETEESAILAGWQTDRGMRDDSRGSVEFSILSRNPASQASDAGFGSSRDQARRLKHEARLPDTSTDKSDITIFSDVTLPALSSTRATETWTQCPRHYHREEQVVQKNDGHADPRSHSPRDIDPFRKRQRSADLLSQVLQSLKDASGSSADLLVTYILQDEKRSVERKLTDALKESAITPVAVQKLLDRLREVDSIRNAHQTETLRILKSILINVNDEAEVDARNVNKNDRQVSPRNRGSAPIRADRTVPDETDKLIWRKGSPRMQTRAKTDASEIERIAKSSHELKHRDDNSSNNPVNTGGSVRDKTRTETVTGGPKGNDDSKGDPCSEAESLKQISDIRSDADDVSGRSSRHPSTETASVKLSKSKMAAGDANITVAPSANEEADVNGERCADDAQDDKNPASQDNAAENEDMMRTAVDELVDAPLLNISAAASGAAEEVATREPCDNVASTTSKNGSLASAGISEMRGQIRSDANSVSAKFLGRLPVESDGVSARSLAREDAGSPRAMKNDINSRHPAEKIVKGEPSPAKSCSADSLRDCASLSSVKNGGSLLKGIADPPGQVSLDIAAGDDSMKKNTRDGIGGKSMTAIQNGDFELWGKSTGNGNEQRSIDATNTLQKSTINILSSSGSSVNSTLLDQDDRYVDGIRGVKIKGIATSSENSSHSEGELYMPSSCSYSLGEVRVLKKRDLIADNTTDRDSSVTVLFTRSMLTSLNDSATSLLGSSERAQINP